MHVEADKTREKRYVTVTTVEINLLISHYINFWTRIDNTPSNTLKNHFKKNLSKMNL